MTVEEELRIEERKALLELEHDLAVLHTCLVRHLRALESDDLPEVADCVRSAQWALGVGVALVARQLQR
jgi:hypothetical protein